MSARPRRGMDLRAHRGDNRWLTPAAAPGRQWRRVLRRRDGGRTHDGQAALAAVLRRRRRGEEPRRARRAASALSTQAVAKLVSALERDLGVRLFDRAPHGLSLTASGAAYRESCLPALSQLQLADELVRAAPAQARSWSRRAARDRARGADAGAAALSRPIPADPASTCATSTASARSRRAASTSFSPSAGRSASDLVLRQIAASRTIVGRLTGVLGRARHAAPSERAGAPHLPADPQRRWHGHGPVDLRARRRAGVGAGPRLADHQQRAPRHGDRAGARRRGRGLHPRLDQPATTSPRDAWCRRWPTGSRPRRRRSTCCIGRACAALPRVRLFIEYVIDAFQQI